MKIINKLGLSFSAGLLGLSLLSPLLNGIHAVFAETSALYNQPGISSGQENGSETDGNHITNSGANGTSTMGVGYTNGSLTLNSVPNFDFGVHPMLSTSVFTLTNQGLPLGQSGADGQRPRAIIVTDTRPLINMKAVGWNLSVVLSSIQGSNGESVPSANEFQMFLGGSGNILDPGGNNPDNLFNYNDPAVSGTKGANTILPGYFDPATNFFTPTSTQSTPGQPNYTGSNPMPTYLNYQTGIYAPIMLNQPVQVLNSDVNAGYKSWAVNFMYKDNAYLYVPLKSQFTNQHHGNYVGTLTWTLGNAPGTDTGN